MGVPKDMSLVFSLCNQNTSTTRVLPLKTKSGNHQRGLTLSGYLQSNGSPERLDDCSRSHSQLTAKGIGLELGTLDLSPSCSLSAT